MVTESSCNVEGFIKSLKLQESIARSILRTIDDCNSFYIGYYGKNNFVTDDLLDYREYKIATSEITLEVFESMCYTDEMKETFELTFLKSFTDLDIEYITNAIAKDKITLEGIYKGFQKNPNKSILKYVL